MPTIAITDETYRKLERLARPFQDRSEEDVIRRLADQALASNPAPSDAGGSKTTGRALVSNKGSLPSGTALKATYRGAEYEAEVRDGKVWWNGRSFATLSAAAVAVIQSTGSARTTENGWRFWQQIPPGKNGSRGAA